MDNGERKSISFEVFEKEAIEVKEGYVPQLDYLKAITALLPI